MRSDERPCAEHCFLEGMPGRIDVLVVCGGLGSALRAEERQNDFVSTESTAHRGCGKIHIHI